MKLKNWQEKWKNYPLTLFKQIKELKKDLIKERILKEISLVTIMIKSDIMQVNVLKEQINSDIILTFIV